MESYRIDPIWRKKEVVGIDIGTKSIKAVQLRKKGKLTKLVAYGKVDLPENYIIEGIISEQDKVAELIKKLLVESKWGEFRAKRVLTSLSEAKIFTKIITLPKMGQKELAEAINWQASQYIPMAMTDLYLDWQVVGPNKSEPGSDDIILAAAPKSIVDSYLQTFSMAGLEVVGLEPSLTSVARAMIPQREKNETVLVIDIGAENTNIAIFDTVIRMTGSTPVGGRQLLPGGELDADKVIKVNSRSADKEAFSQTGLEPVVQEAKKMIKYYEEKVGKENIVNKIFLCGGPATLSGLEEYFKLKLGIEIQVGNPWANISVYPIKPVPKSEASSYTNAIGLALLGFGND